MESENRQRIAKRKVKIYSAEKAVIGPIGNWGGWLDGLWVAEEGTGARNKTETGFIMFSSCLFLSSQTQSDNCGRVTTNRPDDSGFSRYLAPTTAAPQRTVACDIPSHWPTHLGARARASKRATVIASPCSCPRSLHSDLA